MDNPGCYEHMTSSMPKWESMILKEDRRDRSVLFQRIPSPMTENRNRNSSERIPRKKTLNLESGIEDKDEAQDESASVPCRPDTPPKTHRHRSRIRYLSKKKFANFNEFSVTKCMQELLRQKLVRLLPKNHV